MPGFGKTSRVPIVIALVVLVCLALVGLALCTNDDTPESKPRTRQAF